MLRGKRHSPDYVLLATIVALASIGVLMVFSASTSVAHARFGDQWHYIRRQVMWAGVSIVAMLMASKINYRQMRSLSLLGIIMAVGLLLLIFVPQVAISSHGSTRWVKLGPVQVQPSELAKVALIFWVADFLAKKGTKVRSFLHGAMPVLMATGVICGLVYLQPDLGTAVAIAMIAGIMLLAAGMPVYQIGLMGAAGAVAFVGAVVQAPYRLARVMSYRNPWLDPQDTGFQLIQSLYAIGPGGLFGRGIGKSIQKEFFLPEPHNDFIFSVLAEELGFIGGAVLIVLFTLIAVRGMRIALRAPDRFSALLATGITTMVVSQALVNLAVVTGSIPITGIPLPLVSYGGSSLLIVMGALGILLNISKYCKE